MKNTYFYVILTLLASLLVVSVHGQISTPCTTSMISNVTPCLNFITGSSANGRSTPTPSCCASLKWLMSTSTDCACLVLTANVPVQLPINQILSLGLLTACNMGGIPTQCKGLALLTSEILPVLWFWINFIQLWHIINDAFWFLLCAQPLALLFQLQVSSISGKEINVA